MQVSFLTNHIFKTASDASFLTLHKAQIQPDSFVQGQIASNGQGGFIVYPQLVIETKLEKAYPNSTFLGRTVMTKMRELPKNGIGFSLACYDAKADKKTTWIDTVAFEKTADMIKNYAMNTQVVLSGRIEISSYEGKAKIGLVVSQVQLISQKKDDNQQNTPPAQTQAVAAPSTEIPF
jgi:hypothetical protein